MSEVAAQTQQIPKDEQVPAYGSMLSKRLKLARAIKSVWSWLFGRYPIVLAEEDLEPRLVVPP